MEYVKRKPFSCPECKKSFIQYSQLEVHIRQHTGEKPFICNYCFKGFASSKVLKVHERVHTGEKPYKCPYCKKTFSAYANLVVHRRIHTNEKPYSCRLCGRGFEHSGNLSRHFRAHMAESGFRCILCSQIFQEEPELLKHTKVQHASDYRSYISNEKLKPKLDSDTMLEMKKFIHSTNFDINLKNLCSKKGKKKKSKLSVENKLYIKKEVPNVDSLNKVDKLGIRNNFENCNDFICSRTTNTFNNQSFGSLAKFTSIGSFEKSNNSLFENSNENYLSAINFVQKNEGEMDNSMSADTIVKTEESFHYSDPTELDSHQNVQLRDQTVQCTDFSENFYADSFSKKSLKLELEGIQEPCSTNDFTGPPPLIPLNEMDSVTSDCNEMSPASETRREEDISIIGFKNHLRNFSPTSCGFKVDAISTTSTEELEHFKIKVEKTMKVLVGENIMQLFGFPGRTSEQVLIYMLDIAKKNPCADVRVNELDRMKINIRKLIECSFPEAKSWDRLGWNEQPIEFIINVLHSQENSLISKQEEFIFKESSFRKVFET